MKNVIIDKNIFDKGYESKVIKSEFIKNKSYVNTIINIRKIFKERFTNIYYCKLNEDNFIEFTKDNECKYIKILGLWLFGIPGYKPNIKIVITKNNRMIMKYPKNLNKNIKESLDYFCK